MEDIEIAQSIEKEDIRKIGKKIGLKEDDLLAYLELFKQNPLTDTQKAFLMSARRGEFLLNVDSKNRLRIWIRATELEREMMGEE